MYVRLRRCFRQRLPLSPEYQNYDSHITMSFAVSEAYKWDFDVSLTVIITRSSPSLIVTWPTNFLLLYFLRWLNKFGLYPVLDSTNMKLHVIFIERHSLVIFPLICVLSFLDFSKAQGKYIIIILFACSQPLLNEMNFLELHL